MLSDGERELIETLIDRIGALEQKVTESIPGDNLSDWSPEAFHEPGVLGGIVVNEALARSTPCKRISLGDSELWYSKGVVGALSEDEKILYCVEGIEDIAASPEQIERQRVFRDAALLCQREVEGLEPGQKLEPFLKCVSVTAKKKGVNI